MRYLSVAEIAQKWNMSERSVRNYCAQRRIPGAYITGKTWHIPEIAVKPERQKKSSAKSVSLLQILRAEKAEKFSGGIYHKVQIELTYNSNHIEGSRLTHDQTRYIYETNTVGIENTVLNVDDIIETSNHFHCVDLCIDRAERMVTESLIKLLHATLKSGISDSRKDWFMVGEYKKLPNEVGGNETTAPEKVPAAMKNLLEKYNAHSPKTFDEILDFHYQFECIHPFQDGNGRVGRLLLFKECLRNHIVPFIIDEDLKLFYYRGLKEWKRERGYLRDTCLTAQDKFKTYLDYFRISHD